MTIHPAITEKRIVAAVRADNGTGFCTACGKKAAGYVEPDAENYPCTSRKCGQRAVYGAEQLLILTVA